MFYRDHEPAHFHATYGDYAITVDIRTGLVHGEFPKRATRHVLEWCETHRDELLQNWELARGRQPLIKISPLE